MTEKEFPTDDLALPSLPGLCLEYYLLMKSTLS